MIFSIAYFQFRAALRSPSTYIYWFIYSLLGLLWTLAYVGAVPGMDVSMGPEMLLVNSPYVLSQVISLVSIFGVFTVAGVMGRAGALDFLYHSHALVFSKPISRKSYLAGRFAGAYLTLLFIFSGVSLGAWAAVHSGVPAPDLVGRDSIGAYLAPMAISVWPNLFACGAFFFCLTAITRKMTAVYVGSAVLLLGWLMASGVSTGDGVGPVLHALLDPTGIFASDRMTVYWSLAEKNARGVELSGVFLWNRLLWLGFGLVCIAVAMRFFTSAPSTEKKQTKRIKPDREMRDPSTWTPVAPAFNTIIYCKMWLAMAMFELKAILLNRYFAAILTCLVLFMIMSSLEIGPLTGSYSYPVTWLVLSKVGQDFELFILVLAAFYAGEIVHRERDVALNQIHDALPMPNWTPLTAKAAGLIALVLVLLGMVFICGVSVQLLRGWTQLNLPLYTLDLLVIRFSRLTMICILAIFLHVLVNHKPLGHMAMLLYLLFSLAAPKLGLEHPLLRFASAPRAVWSDMNGFGAALWPHLAYKGFWAIFSLLLVLLSLLLWTRGTSLSLTARVRRAIGLPRPWRLIYGVLGLWLAYGALLFYKSNVVATFETRNQKQARAAELEQQYGNYRNLPNFSVDHADLQIHLYAAKGALEMEGAYVLENRQSIPLDRIALNVGRFVKLTQLAPHEAFQPEVFRPDLGFYVLKLNQPIPPGETIGVSFAYTCQKPDLPAQFGSHQLFRNGTFLKKDYFPMTGFPEDRILKDNAVRKKHGLPPKLETPDPNDPNARKHSGLGGDTTLASLRVLATTDLDQIPMVPAPLIKSYQQNGRRVALFDTKDEKVMFFPTLVSAKYQVARDRLGDVELEIYHHPSHNQNIDSMMLGLKQSIEYCENAFGPYPHKFVRILEFPRHRKMAQSLTGTIPFSEGLGFIARVEEGRPDSVDYPFFVTAHEMAHQWWPHQVMPANARGGNFLSESLAQYTALKIMEKNVGKGRMTPMLRIQRHKYLKERGELNHKEPPLTHVDDEHFIYYNKGGLALYALAERIGEDRVNRALRRYLELYGGREDQFPVSTDLVSLLRDETPEAYQYLIKDLFEQVTFHKLRILSAERRTNTGVETTLVVNIQSSKFRASGLGDQTEVEMNDQIDIAFLDRNGNKIHAKKIWLKSGDSEWVFPDHSEVERVVLDPSFAVMDTVLEDNQQPVSNP